MAEAVGIAGVAQSALAADTIGQGAFGFEADGSSK